VRWDEQKKPDGVANRQEHAANDDHFHHKSCEVHAEHRCRARQTDKQLIDFQFDHFFGFFHLLTPFV
jgi:hypothetical protein